MYNLEGLNMVLSPTISGFSEEADARLLGALLGPQPLYAAMDC